MGAFENFLVLVVIGAGIGFTMIRYDRSGAGRPVPAGTGDVTYALVGIAGSFMGFHIGIILGLLAQFVLYVLAAAGAGVTVWIWRGG